MPGIRRKSYEFTPVIMIAEQHRTPADLAAIQHIHDLHGIVMSTMDTERSRKLEIGISEIGDDCAKCVARKLSMRYPKRNEGGAGWRAQVGTMTHDYLERHFVQQFPWMFEYNVETRKWDTVEGLEPTLEQPIYYLERKLKVWEYETVVDGEPYKIVLDGSCDLFSRLIVLDQNRQPHEIGIVTDWKVQGERALADSGKGKLKGAYRVQLPTYGLGYELAGFHPTHLDLHALPRDDNLDASRPILMRYDRQVALDAIARIKAMIDGAAILGWERFIELQPTAPGCWDCRHFDSVDESNFIESIVA